MFVCLFELIEELAGVRNLKIGVKVSNDISTKVFVWLRKNFTPSLKKVPKCLSLYVYDETNIVFIDYYIQIVLETAYI